MTFSALSFSGIDQYCIDCCFPSSLWIAVYYLAYSSPYCIISVCIKNLVLHFSFPICWSMKRHGMIHGWKAKIDYPHKKELKFLYRRIYDILIQVVWNFYEIVHCMILYKDNYPLKLYYSLSRNSRFVNSHSFEDLSITVTNLINAIHYIFVV